MVLRVFLQNPIWLRAWPELPAALRADIVAMIEATLSEGVQ
jgi:hypothetical protein